MKVLLQDVKKIETEAVIVGFYEDVRPLKGAAGVLDWLLCGSLSHLLLSRKLSGSLGDVALLTSRGKIPAPKIFMVGLGPWKALSPHTLRDAARTGSGSAVEAGIANVVMDYFPVSGLQPPEYVTALREGIGEGARGRGLDVTLLAHDAASYERLNRLVRA